MLSTIDISLLITSIGVAGSVIVACLLWIYRELNSLRAEIANFRVEVALEYVSAKALKEVEIRLENALDRLGIKFDKAVDMFTQSIIKHAVEIESLKANDTKRSNKD